MKKISHKNSLMKTIENQNKEEIEELLRRLFVDDNLTQEQIAEKLQISYVTVLRWLRMAGIRHRRINLGD